MSRLDRVTSDPSIWYGQPTIRGLRYPVENLLELLASGMTIDEIIEDHDDLERDDLLARSSSRRSPLGCLELSRSAPREVPRRRAAPCPIEPGGLPKRVTTPSTTSELPDGNQTTDAEITRRADDEDRVVVTKDGGFGTVTSCGLSHAGCWS